MANNMVLASKHVYVQHTVMWSLHLPWHKQHNTWSICPLHWSIVTSNNFAALHCWSSCAEESVIILEWNMTNQKSNLLQGDKKFNQEATIATHGVFYFWCMPSQALHINIKNTFLKFMEDAKLWQNYIWDISTRNDDLQYVQVCVTSIWFLAIHFFLYLKLNHLKYQKWPLTDYSFISHYVASSARGQD